MFCIANRRKRIWWVLCLFMHVYLLIFAYMFMCFIAIFIVYCDAWVKGELPWSFTLIHTYITSWVLSLSKWGRLLAQWPITLVLMMINSCSYSTNDLVFNYWQIHDQDLSRCVASTKDLKSSFGASTVWFKSLCIKTTSCTQEESSSMDRVWTKSRRCEDFKWRPSRSRLVSRFIFYKILFLDKM